MEKKCPDCGHNYNPELIKQLNGGCPKCMADLLRNETDLLNPDESDGSGSFGRAPFDAGTTYHGMEIIKLLGRGGMGYVYKARQPNLNRFVALKILDPRLAGSAGFTERFNREAKALAALNHPNIVQVYDYGHEGSHHFLVMELVEGANLREILLTSRIEPKTALRYVPQICDALEYAHAKGVIHRDIKPENILIDKQGHLKIADFGLAKMKVTGDDASRITQADQVMGTPSYMAPEQMKEGASVDHRADIYSLGVVFYEMLTGELPVGRFPVPSQRVKVDVRLDEVVLKALEKDIQRRYQQAS